MTDRIAPACPAATAFSWPRRLLVDVRGATVVMFGLLSVPLLLAMGGAVDAGLAYQKRAQLQNALDAAVLAGSIAVDAGKDGPAAVRSYLDANFDQIARITSTVATTVDPTKAQISAVARIDVPTAFLGILGLKKLSPRVSATATYGGNALQVALALDVTGSMAGAKLSALKSSAKDLVKTLMSGQAGSKTKIGMVPFSRYVGIGTSYRGQGWLDVPNDTSWTTYDCWDTYPQAVCYKPYTVKTTCYNDGVPYACSYTQCTRWDSGPAVKQCAYNNHTSRWYGCVGSRTYPLDLQAAASTGQKIPGVMDETCNGQLQRLTGDTKTISAAIDGLHADGETYIAPGVLWAWRMLSSKPPFGDGATDPSTTRAIVLMTDGANTISATYPRHWGSDVANSNDVLAKTCANAKSDGIAIYTIAFQVTDPTIKKILEQCATSSSNYYDSSNIAALTAAFQRIGEQLSSRRITR